MGSRARGNPVALGLWLVGLLVLASIGGGLGAFLFGAWATAGVAAARQGGTVADLQQGLGAIALALFLLGLLWWWASAPGSVLASAAGYLGPAFLGALAGGAGGWLWQGR